MTGKPENEPRLSVAHRQGDAVSPLELFFDLVFVLAITQCSALMAHDPTWRGLAHGLVVLGLLWWSWVGYAWLTSVVDPDDSSVRLVLFIAMAALLVCSLAVPHAFENLGVTFAIAYGVVRAAHIALFVLASRDDVGLRHSVVGLAISTAFAVALLLVGSALHGDARLATWAAALAFDMAGPLFIDTSGWRLVPGHFAERHGLIVIVALGESIVAIGVGAEAGIDAGIVVAAVLGVAVAGALWWMYFDTTALAAARQLGEVEDIKARNELARDAFSYLHLPMVAGIVLLALGMKTTLHGVGHSLSWEATAALVGGPALYVFAQVAFKRRVLTTLSVQRLVAATVLVLFIPLAHLAAAVIALAVVAVVLWSLLVYETVRFADARRAVRNAPVRPH
ncbi:MAG TPA: low temperature requirement protein A [Acidimicrobiales bacterium]|nr:low temperature requirement protein A [Acidimicrobiales bacterium]